MRLELQVRSGLHVRASAGPEAEFHPGFPGCWWLSYWTGWEGRQKSIRRPSSGSWRRMTSWSSVLQNIRTKAGRMSVSSTSMCYTEISFIWLPSQMPTSANQCFISNGIVFQLAVVRSNWMWSMSYEMDFCQLNCLECEWNLCGSFKNVKMWRKLLT